MIKRFLIVSIGIVLAATMCLEKPAMAADEDFQKQIDLLNKRVSELEKKLDQPQAVLREWDPTEEMSRWQNEMNELFRGSFSRPGFPSGGIFNGNLSYSDELALQ